MYASTLVSANVFNQSGVAGFSGAAVPSFRSGPETETYGVTLKVTSMRPRK
jgi:hypothetical protein